MYEITLKQKSGNKNEQKMSRNETETYYYQERVNRFRIQMKYAGPNAREDEAWTLKWSFADRENAEHRLGLEEAQEAKFEHKRYDYRLVDNGEASIIRREAW